MKITTDQLPNPAEWGWTEVRTVDQKGETIALLLDITEVALEDGELLSFSGRVKGYMKDNRADSRISNQKRSIDELLAHLKHHCPKLKSLKDCDYLPEEKS